jgi:hypothetical protein
MATARKMKGKEMPRYKIVKTEEAYVWATDEEDALEKAIEEFAELPDGDYEVTLLKEGNENE